MRVRFVVTCTDTGTPLTDERHDMPESPLVGDVVERVAIDGYRAPVVAQRRWAGTGAAIELVAVCWAGPARAVQP